MEIRRTSEHWDPTEPQVQLRLAQRGLRQTSQGGLGRGVHTPAVSWVVIYLPSSHRLSFEHLAGPNVRGSNPTWTRNARYHVDEWRCCRRLWRNPHSTFRWREVGSRERGLCRVVVWLPKVGQDIRLRNNSGGRLSSTRNTNAYSTGGSRRGNQGALCVRSSYRSPTAGLSSYLSRRFRRFQIALKSD